MAYKSVKVKYYNGGQYNKSTVFNNDTDDFIKFCKMIRNGNFTPTARKQAYMDNLDNLIVWLDGQYCDVDMFLNVIFNDMFISGQNLVSLLSTLQKENATAKDFNELNFI